MSEGGKTIDLAFVSVGFGFGEGGVVDRRRKGFTRLGWAGRGASGIGGARDEDSSAPSDDEVGSVEGEEGGTRRGVGDRAVKGGEADRVSMRELLRTIE